MFVNITLYFNVVTFLPLHVAEFFPDITSFGVGALLSAYPLTFLLVAPICGEVTSKVGRRNGILIALIVDTFATFLFGTGAYCEKQSAFMGISAIARILQGASDAIIAVSVQSIIVLEYPED